MTHQQTRTIAAAGAGFGTAPVFMATISTILGAILFLRFGYAIAHVGFWGVITIIVLGHIVTIATAMAVAEIATNQKVEGGGAYFMISRSFGLNIGAAIGVALFLAQAISVAFYVIAFAEAFEPVFTWVNATYGLHLTDMRLVSLPVMAILTALILTKGAGLGVKALYVVVAILFISLILFFAGHTDYVAPATRFHDTVANPDNFFYVFTIIFPAFTGIAAGLGLSGDLKEPRKAIPLGTLSATLFGMVVYVFVAYKLTISASPEVLAGDQLFMSQIAAWGPIIPIGLACACISSALGSILIAPRTLQALGKDRVFPSESINTIFGKGKGATNEPFNSAVITCLIAFAFIAMGNVNFVAEIISMFFIVTYGAICLISFLEHFAADPAYRPTFKSKWYLSLVGAIFCFWLMFQMNFLYAVLSLVLMAGIYIFITHFKEDREGLASIFQGVIFQVTRGLQVFLQTRETDDTGKWRPAIVAMSKDTFKRTGAFDLLTWLSHRYGFGTYLHYIPGYLSKASGGEAHKAIQKMLKMGMATHSHVYIDSHISPSFTTAVAQVIQLPGMSGKDNNMVMFEFPKAKPELIEEVVDNFPLIKSLNFDVCILGSSDRGFGYKRDIHIWITSRDIENANLMILLGFILQGHPDWGHSEIKIMSIVPEAEIEQQKQELMQTIEAGRLSISRKNVQLIPQKQDADTREIINARSEMADVTIIGFQREALKRLGTEIFTGYDNIGNVLFVNTTKIKRIE